MLAVLEIAERRGLDEREVARWPLERLALWAGFYRRRDSIRGDGLAGLFGG